MPIPSGSPSLVTLSDVHGHLGIPTSDTAKDTKLQGFIDAAAAFITYQTGPILPVQFVEVYDGGNPTILLWNPPVLTVQAVTEYVGLQKWALTAQPLGSTVDNYGYSLDDPTAGLLVRRGSSGVPMPFWGGPRSVTVTYTAGTTSVPPDVRMAALEDIRGLYQQTQQGRAVGGGTIGAGGDDSWTVGPMNLFPRLASLLDGPRRTPAIG